MKIGFFGLGNMGVPMAENLVKGGYALTVYDVVPDAMKKMKEKGVILAGSTPKACSGMDVVISMLPSGEAACELYLSEKGVLNKASKTTLLIDCSTIAPEHARQIAMEAMKKGFDMVDAPVSGGVAGAESAQLTFIVGGSEKAYKRALPFLKAMGKKIFHAGDSGSGQVAKVCNNMLLAIHMMGTVESLKLGMKNGMDPKILSTILKNSSGDNWTLQKYNPCPYVMENVPSSNNYKGGFSVELMVKDLGLAHQTTEQSRIETPLGRLVFELYKKHLADGHGKQDFSSIFNTIK